ncbi:MAG: alpha/beta fold hydrolase [Phreatobacter sp.]|nr:alpha/beta fold hydrolase [Phreatobacter sp.]
MALLATLGPAHSDDTRPAALLLDGLFIYVHQSYVGVSALAPMLERMGYSAAVDTHLMTRSAQREPVLIIGHSMGGSAALRRAREMVVAGKPAPVVITIDAAFGSPPCPVPRCINYYSPGFPKVEGAENIDAWEAGAFLVNHAMLATSPVVQRLVLERANALIAERAAAAAADRSDTPEPRATPPLTAPLPLPRPFGTNR